MAAFFHPLEEYPLAVCRECRHGVLPSHVQSHLQRTHKVPQKQAEEEAEEIGSWAGLVQYAGDIQVPEVVVEPVGQLPVYTDGLLCRLDPSSCRQVFRSVHSMRKHWQKAHGWSTGGKKGRPSRVAKERIQSRSQEGYQPVHCQRLFIQGPGSQYFQVHPLADEAETVPVDKHVLWTRVGEALAKVKADTEQQSQVTIQGGEQDEVNPWLERTQWEPYLVGLARPDLLASIEQPAKEPDPQHGQEDEPVEAAIWAAMGGLARFSQASVIYRVGVFVRMESIRTEKHQTRFQPLQPYMNEKAILDHTRPWKQMLMFFARTQREHTWTSPQYKFTQQQQAAWEALVEAAGGTEQEDEGIEEEEVDNEEEDEEEDNEEDNEEDKEQDEEQDNHTREDNTPPALTRIQKACLTFCIALLNQSITRKEYDNPLVCALAVLGVQESGWKGAESYPPILSEVIKIARFMVVQQALELSEPSELDSDSAYESEDSSQERPQPKGCLQFVQEMMDQFMVRGSHGPMQWMLDLRTYGLKIHYNSTARGHVEWMGPDELLYKDIHFTMAQFRGMVHGLVVESRRLLMEELLLSSSKNAVPVPSIPWSQLRDNPTDNRPGWNFLHDHRTKMPVNGEKWLFDRIGEEASIRDPFIKQGTQSGLNRKEVERYMDRIVAFREKLIVLMHIAGGQPGRGPEILSVRHSNTVKGGHRNIFVEDGMVVYATRYHKGYHVSGDVKIIHRYLPREVGELVVWYMWLVLPFQQQLEAMVWEKKVISSHLWPADPSGRKWTSDRLREVLRRESRVGMGQELTIAAYRQIAIGISRRFMRASTSFQAEEGDEKEEWNEENMAAITADLQSGHTAHIAGMIYARGTMEQAGATADQRQLFRQSSTYWHQFLGFPGEKKEGGTEDRRKKRKRAPFESEADEARIDRLGRLRKMDTAAQLQRMMGTTAQFRGIQKEAIDAIVAGESPVVAVMPTGAGKSMLFMLPAWAESGGTTIVVVPLIALRKDMKKRCKKLGISCEEWASSQPPDAAAVVLVTPESAVDSEFITFINRLRATRQLDRIVVDECHMVLNQQYTFRKQMQQLGRLAVAETQMVLLTATLPPTEEDELYRRMHFDPEQVKMFRADTTRSNIAYRVVQVDRRLKTKEVETVVEEMVRQKEKEYTTGKIIVYGNSVNKVSTLAERLGCDAYHHHAVGKVSMMEDFTAGKQRVIVATSALGLGVDIPEVRCVIHIDWPFSMLDYAQESGRAGRDELPSEAVMIVQDGYQKVGIDKHGKAAHALVGLYVQGIDGVAQCRRVVLGRYLDKREKVRVGCEKGEERCDVCRRGNEREEREETEAEEDEREETEGRSGSEREETEAEAVEQRRQEERRVFMQQEQERRGLRQTLTRCRQKEFADIEWLRRQLAWWGNRCGMCEAAGEGQSGHDIRQCWRVESDTVKATIRKLENDITFDPFSGCFWCGVPQAICNAWEENDFGRYQKAKQGSCQYRGVLLSGLVGAVVGYSSVGARWVTRLDALGVTETLEGYLGKKQMLETVESNHLAGEFCWVTRLLAE